MRIRVSMLAAVLAFGASQTLHISPAIADVKITVDKTAQTLTVEREGKVLHTWPVSTGRTGRFTPSGNFRAFRMEKDHFSREFDDAPMPHSIFFTQRGHAIHGSFETKKLGRPASGGCVRLAPENAKTLFELVQAEGVLKTKVDVQGDERIAIARASRELAQSPQRQASRESAGQAPQYAERGRYDPTEPPQAQREHYAAPRGSYDPQFGQQQQYYYDGYSWRRGGGLPAYRAQQPYYEQRSYYPPQPYYYPRRYNYD